MRRDGRGGRGGRRLVGDVIIVVGMVVMGN